MSPILWDRCRRQNGSINLQQAARQTGAWFSDHALRYLDVLEELKPIESRQVAALAIANALEISSRAAAERNPSSQEGK